MYGKQPVTCLVDCQSHATFQGLAFPGFPDLMHQNTEQTCKHPCKQPANSMGVNGKQPVTRMAAR